MDEDILAAVHRDEAEALFRIVPFHLAVDFLSRPGRSIEGTFPRGWPAATAAAKSRRTARGRGLGRAGINGGDLGDLRPLRPLPHPHRQGRSRFERGMP